MAPASDIRATNSLAAAAFDGPDQMGREIAEGPEAVVATLQAVASVSDEVGRMLDGADRIIVLATGASLATSQAAAPIWRRVLYRPLEITVRQSTEAVLDGADGYRLGPGDVVVAVSQSGNSPETVAAARAATRAAAPVLAITAHDDSLLAKAADAVLVIGSGKEAGAATKSELATLAALLGLCGALSTDPATSERLGDRLRAFVQASWGDAIQRARVLAAADRLWILGFGSATGLASAGALLWHEKVRRPAVAASPSEFRHGLVEAATDRSAVVLIDIGPPDPGRSAYLDRLRGEVDAVGATLVELSSGEASPEPSQSETALHAALALQQLARAAAIAGGTYREEFAILHNIVKPATDLLT